jgi:hypothetical protein
MGFLRSIESRIEGAFEGTFGRAFRASVEPVEIARKLAKELEDGKVVSVNHVYAPNEYTVFLHPKDRQRFTDYEASLRAELAVYLGEHARREGYVLTSRPRVAFQTETRLSPGTFGISTGLTSPDEPLPGSDAPIGPEPAAAPAPAPEADGPEEAEPAGAPVLAPEAGGAEEAEVAPGVAAAAEAALDEAPQPPLPDAPLVAPLAAAAEPLVEPVEPLEPLLPAAELVGEPDPLPVPEPVAVGAEAPLEDLQATRIVPAAEARLAPDAALVLDGRRVPLVLPVTLIGRASGCDVVLDDPNASRRHAELRRRGESATVVDLDSTNGTVVNGRRVREQPLRDGDRITIGTTTLVFERR